MLPTIRTMHLISLQFSQNQFFNCGLVVNGLGSLKFINFLLNLVFDLKFLAFLIGREDPIEFNIWSLFLCCLFVLRVDSMFCWGDGRNLLNSPLFCYIYLCLL